MKPGRIEQVTSGVVFRNPRPGHRVVNAYLPFIEEVGNEELLCVYRRGCAFYSFDGVLARSRSGDGGKTWDEERLVWDPRVDDRPYSYSAPFLAKLRDGTLVLSAFRVDGSDPERLMVNPETGGFLPAETLLFTSSDNGQSWSPPRMVRLPQNVIAYLAGPVVELNDGAWFLPFDMGKAYDDPALPRAVMMGLFSRDRGRTWGNQIFFGDGAPQRKAHWHGRVVKLRDGRLFTLLWTQDLTTGQFVNLHRTVSNEGGTDWSIPEATNLPGQTSWAVDLGDERMFAAYTARDSKTPGIQGVFSDDGGKTWDSRNNVILWDATGRETIGVAATDAYPVSHDVIAFGRPQATALSNGDVAVSFWCTEACLTEARWCRLRVR